jgi:hypothetical protein
MQASSVSGPVPSRARERFGGGTSAFAYGTLNVSGTFARSRADTWSFDRGSSAPKTILKPTL